MDRNSSDATVPEVDEFLEIRDRLFDDLVELVDLWAQYRFLFRESAERIARLNEHADWFFGTLQHTFAQQLVLSIARLTDPARSQTRSGERRNVTLAALLEDPRLPDDSPVRAMLTDLIDKAANRAEPIRLHRNRAVAHADHAAAFGYGPLPTVRWSLFEEVIHSLTEIHQLYSVEVLGRGAAYDIHPLKSAQALVEALELMPTRKEWRLRMKLVEMRKQAEIGGCDCIMSAWSIS